MNIDRLKVLSNEIRIINAIINNEKNVRFNDIYKDNEDISISERFERLCIITYQILNSFELENETALLNMFKELYDDSNIGRFCIDFIKHNTDKTQMGIDEKINLLVKLDCSMVPKSQIKIDYLNLTLGLLLKQQPLNLKLINKYNEEIKKMLDEE